MSDYSTASRTKDHYEEQLLREHPQIVSIAPRSKLDENGIPTGDAVIVIGLRSRRSPLDQSRETNERRAPIPARLPVIDSEGGRSASESVEVVTEEEGDVVAGSLTTSLRPCPGGYSVGNFRGTGGTLGGIVRRADTSWCGLLSNNHVLAALNLGEQGDPIYQPGPFDGGTNGDVIGHLERWIPLKFDGAANEVDCAVATALDPCAQSVTRHVYRIGVPGNVAAATQGQPIRKCGKATEITTGTILSNNATVVVSYGLGLQARFVHQLQYTKMAEQGDSGSLLWDSDSLTVVGLHIGASGGLCYGNKIDKVLAALGVSLV